MSRHFVVGVMGSGWDEWLPYSDQLGRLVAELGHSLLTGGGGGVMRATARAFVSVEKRRGVSIGIVPTERHEDRFRPKTGYPNEFVELPIIGPLGSFTGEDPEQVSRNHVNVLTSDAIVALPGSVGTANEIELARRFNRPLLLFGPADAFPAREPAVSRTIEQVEEFLRSVGG